MRRLRDLVASVEEAIEQQRTMQSERPTSMREAGRVGSSPEMRTLRPTPLPVRDAAIETGQEKTAEERTTRRKYAPVVAAPRRKTATAAQLRTALRNPATFRNAVLLREVLDAPISKRPKR